jgi:hypothetical protein
LTPHFASYNTTYYARKNFIDDLDSQLIISILEFVGTPQTFNVSRRLNVCSHIAFAELGKMHARAAIGLQGQYPPKLFGQWMDKSEGEATQTHAFYHYFVNTCISLRAEMRSLKREPPSFSLPQLSSWIDQEKARNLLIEGNFLALDGRSGISTWHVLQHTPHLFIKQAEMLRSWLDTHQSDLERIAGLDMLNFNITTLYLAPRCIQLVHLNLTHNQLSDLSFVRTLPLLRRLWLGNNQISNLTPLQWCPELRILEIYNNPISDLSSLATLVNLRIVHVNSTQITTLSALVGLTRLKKLFVHTVPWLSSVPMTLHPLIFYPDNHVKALMVKTAMNQQTVA